QCGIGYTRQRRAERLSRTGQGAAVERLAEGRAAERVGRPDGYQHPVLIHDDKSFGVTGEVHAEAAGRRLLQPGVARLSEQAQPVVEPIDVGWVLGEIRAKLRRRYVAQVAGEDLWQEVAAQDGYSSEQSDASQHHLDQEQRANGHGGVAER